jgi:hypothetical protein
MYEVVKAQHYHLVPRRLVIHQWDMVLCPPHVATALPTDYLGSWVGPHSCYIQFPQCLLSV